MNHPLVDIPWDKFLPFATEAVKWVVGTGFVKWAVSTFAGRKRLKIVLSSMEIRNPNGQARCVLLIGEVTSLGKEETYIRSCQIEASQDGKVVDLFEAPEARGEDEYMKPYLYSLPEKLKHEYPICVYRESVNDITRRLRAKGLKGTIVLRLQVIDGALEPWHSNTTTLSV